MFIRLKFTDDMLREAMRVEERATMNLVAAIRTRLHIEQMVVERILAKKGVYKGQQILVKWTDGEESCKFIGFKEEIGRFDNVLYIELRGTTKAGKPRKGLTHIASNWHDIMFPIPKGDE